MRREGFELAVSRPRVVFQTDRATGERLEPIEEVMIDVDDEFTGVVIEKLSRRKAELKDMGPSGAGKTRLVFNAPSRALIGYQGEFLTDTRGSGVLNRVFRDYEPYKGAIEAGARACWSPTSDGETAAYALWNLEERGAMFIGAGEKIYRACHRREHPRRRPRRQPDEGQAADQRPRRRQGRGHPLTPPRRPTLEQAIAYIEEDELVEVTPKVDPAAQAASRRQRAPPPGETRTGCIARCLAPRRPRRPARAAAILSYPFG